MPRDLLPEGLLAQPVWEMALEIPGVCVCVCSSVQVYIHKCAYVYGGQRSALDITPTLFLFAYFFFFF